MTTVEDLVARENERRYVLALEFQAINDLSWEEVICCGHYRHLLGYKPKEVKMPSGYKKNIVWNF